MKKLIVVSDWSSDSLTRQEFRSAAEGFLKSSETPNITFVASTPSTIHTSFLMSQVIATEEHYGRPREVVIFQNTDPRIQTTEGVAKARGAEFIIVRLVSGMMLCGPNAGYDFSLIKSKIDQAFLYKDMDKGSQFRSRDLYSRASAHLMDGLEKELDLEEVSRDIIPNLEGQYVAHIDNYGNIKTTLIKEDFKGKYEFGDSLTVCINGIEKQAEFVENLFGGGVGKLVVYPGSSGIKDNPYLEVSVWRHFTEDNPTTGAAEFDSPRPGMKIEIK